MLPSERRRVEETARREAEGESLWTPDFDKRARVRLAELWAIFAEEVQGYQDYLGDRVATLLRAWAGWNIRSFDKDTFKRDVGTELLLDGLAASAVAIEQMRPHDDVRAEFERGCNVIMNEHRVAHKFVGGELIPFESDELLQNVVEPTLRLLVDSRFHKAHDAYLKALKEIASDDAGDAITDAGTALQETLIALGCKGNALGPLLKDARKNGLLAAHDQTLVDGIAKFIDWASADRSTTGDAHKHTEAGLADAWLMVHVVGAIIVRLADPGLRGGSTR